MTNIIQKFIRHSIVLTCILSIQVYSQLKWFPGHYIDAGVDQYDSGTTAIATLKGENGYLFQG